MDGGGARRHTGAPRTLDVQQFANARGAEVQALHAVLESKKRDGKQGSEGVGAIARCLRRRTTSHNRRQSFFWHRKQKKRKRGAMDEEPRGKEESVAPVESPKPPCRRVRRRIELKGDGRGGGGCSRDGTQRLVTHVWHAKRFTMTKAWGHWLAEGLPGRGLGSRAVVKWVREGAILQDASFYSAIELEGSGNSIIEALQLVLEPAPVSVKLMSPKDQAVYSGAEHGKAMLHHMGSSPLGAIAPVTFIWRPELKVGEVRRVWLWVHAAAFEEAFACLQHLCQSQGVHEKDYLQCWSRKGQLGRLDLLGSKAMSILQKVLHPVARQAQREGCVEAVPPSSSDSSSLIASLRFLEDPRQISGDAVVGMEVWDPRGLPESDTKFQPSVVKDAGSDENEVEAMNVTASNCGRSSTLNRVDAKSNNSGQMMLEKAERHLSGNREVWDLLGITEQDRILKPCSEKDMSTRRHNKRLSYIQLNGTSEDAREELSAGSENFKCPIVVLKHDHHRSSACGFSLIMPVAWVRAFWVPLVFAGGHAVGLRERHWLHTDAKLPSFPHDYPDCSSYDQHMAEKAVEDQETYNRKPPSKRGLWRNELPDWKFANEASALHSGNSKTAQGASTAEFGLKTICGPVCETPSKPSSDALASLPTRNLTADMSPRHIGDDSDCAPVASTPMEAEREGHISDHPIGLQEEHSPQLDPTSSSGPSAIIIEEHEREIDSSAVNMEASTSAPSVDLVPETRGQIDNASTRKEECVLAGVGERKASESGDTGESPLFVVRTRQTLEKVLRDCDLHHLPLCTNVRGAPDSILPSHPTWQLVGDGSSELVKKGCLVRVLIHAPRKGVFDSGAIIYLPVLSDVDSYNSSSQRWQGFEDQSFKQVQQHFLNKRKRRKENSKEDGKSISTPPSSVQPGTTCRTDLPELRSKDCSLRVPIGIVTSGSVRGSTHSAAIGICEVAALGVLRAMQVAAGEKSPSSEIFLLARNASSSTYRPALASIVAEDGDDLE